MTLFLCLIWFAIRSTLKIEYSKSDNQRLSVKYNSDDTKDYSAEGVRLPNNPQQVGLGMVQSNLGYRGPGGYPRGGQQHVPGQYQLGMMPGPGGQGSTDSPWPNQVSIPGSVIMFYNLSMVHFNCSKLFNIVCLFANPIKVKFVCKYTAHRPQRCHSAVAVSRSSHPVCTSTMRMLVLFFYGAY